MKTQEAFETLGGRKFFGLITLALLMTVVAVFGKSLTPELSAGLVALYAAFVGGNAFTTVKGMSAEAEVNYDVPTQAAQPAQDLTPIFNEINSMNERLAEATSTAEQAGQAVLQIGNQLQALKNLTAAALKK